MARFAVDCGVVLRIAEGAAEVHPSHQLVAPSVVRSHALAALYDAVRSGELERKTALERLERIAQIRMRLLNDRVSRRRAWELAERLGWSNVSDAEYVSVAQLQADAFVTLDAALARALEGVVPTAGIDALATPAA